MDYCFVRSIAVIIDSAMKKANKFWTFSGVLLFAVVVYFLAKNADIVTQVIYKSGAWAPIIATLLYPLLAPTPITTDPITVIMVVTYGPWAGAGIALVGNTLAALLEYYLGTRINKIANFEKNKKKLPFGLGKMPVNSVVFLIFGRMIPGYGAKIISILAGTYRVPIKKYIWTTLVTTSLGSLLLAFGTTGLVSALKSLKIFGLN